MNYSSFLTFQVELSFQESSINTPLEGNGAHDPALIELGLGFDFRVVGFMQGNISDLNIKVAWACVSIFDGPECIFNTKVYIL